jgi:hypothetical protein
MLLIETKTLESSASSIEFVSIPEDFTDLVVLASVRGARSAILEVIRLHFNSSLSGYSRRTLFSEGGAFGSETQTDRLLCAINGNTSTSNNFSNFSVYIPNYRANKNKPFFADSATEHDGSLTAIWLTAGLWSNTDPITSLSFVPGNANLLTGSTISLYGVKKGSDGIVTTA